MGNKNVKERGEERERNINRIYRNGFELFPRDIQCEVIRYLSVDKEIDSLIESYATPERNLYSCVVNYFGEEFLPVMSYEGYRMFDNNLERTNYLIRVNSMEQVLDVVIFPF